MVGKYLPRSRAKSIGKQPAIDRMPRLIQRAVAQDNLLSEVTLSEIRKNSKDKLIIWKYKYKLQNSSQI